MNTTATKNESAYWALKASSGWLSGRAYPIIPSSSNSSVTIGRSKQCDIAFPGSQLSKKHVEITVTESGLKLKDLDSKHGLFINDKRTQAGTVKQGDRIHLDVFKFEVIAPMANSIEEESIQAQTDAAPGTTDAAPKKAPTAIEQQQKIIESSEAKATEDRALSKNAIDQEQKAKSSPRSKRPNPLLENHDEREETKSTGVIVAVLAITLIGLSVWLYQYTQT